MCCQRNRLPELAATGVRICSWLNKGIAFKIACRRQLKIASLLVPDSRINGGVEHIHH